MPMADGSLYGACAELQWGGATLRQFPCVLGQRDGVLGRYLGSFRDSSTIAQCGCHSLDCLGET